MRCSSYIFGLYACMLGVDLTLFGRRNLVRGADKLC